MKEAVHKERPSRIEVCQVGSSIRCTERQKGTLRGLGVRRIGDMRILEDTPAVRGMIVKVAHLVTVKPVTEV